MTVFTIVAKNYLAHARALMESVSEQMPEARRVVFLVDRPEGYVEAEDEAFELVTAEALGLPQGRWFFFKYSVLEAATAIKPWCIEWLWSRGEERLFYVDPDIVMFGRLSEAEAGLESGLVLTPHLLRPQADDEQPNEIDILRSGVYNLGFLGIRKTEATERLVRWWKRRLTEYCRSDQDQGLFVDQRWMDLAPAFVPGAMVLGHAGYNVAYWNLKERRLGEGGLLESGEALRFFHFSGFDPRRPRVVSKHQTRVDWQDLNEAEQRLFEGYAERLLGQGFLTCQKWPYDYGYWPGGMRIYDGFRRIWWEAPAVAQGIEDPFSEAGRDAILGYWFTGVRDREGRNSGVPRWIYDLYLERPDVMGALPDLFERDREDVLYWSWKFAPTDHQLPDEYVPLLKQRVAEAAHPVEDQWRTVDGRVEPPPAVKRLREGREDLREAFPDGGLGLLNWFLTAGLREYSFRPDTLRSGEAVWREALAGMPVMERMRWERERWMALIAAWRRPLDPRWPGRLFHPEAEGVEVRVEVRAREMAPNGRPFGVNLLGYLAAEMGVGESVRLAARALEAAGVSRELFRIPAHELHRQRDDRYAAGLGAFPYFASVFHVNADETENCRKHLPEGYPRDGVEIGYWAWELEAVPDVARAARGFYHEIWTPSEFCRTAFERAGLGPVEVMPHAVQVEGVSRFERAQWGLPEGQFLFLTALDALSVMERKNPLGVLRAFRRIRARIPGAGLVIKVSNGARADVELKELRRLAQGLPVWFLEETLTRGEVYGLMESCDCLVSAHRSEGFGLMLAEAMDLERPVIATGYSGNLDFMNEENSYLIPYRMRKVGTGSLPYDRNAEWADPEVGAIGEAMVRVVEDGEDRVRRAREGRATVRRQLAPAVIGARMKARLEALYREVQRGG
jgi:glycosyltransferase involved in cell wall biosynthesis